MTMGEYKDLKILVYELLYVLSAKGNIVVLCLITKKTVCAKIRWTEKRCKENHPILNQRQHLATLKHSSLLLFSNVPLLDAE